MTKKLITIIIITHIIAIGVGVYGGMKYDASKNVSQLAARSQGGFGSGRRDQGISGQRGQAGGFGGGDFSGGQITAKDDTSITIKTRNGSSQIIFFSPSTMVDKSVSGAVSDLGVGQQITASGKSNPDGTLAAQNIQIRPNQPNQ